MKTHHQSIARPDFLPGQGVYRPRPVDRPEISELTPAKPKLAQGLGGLAVQLESKERSGALFRVAMNLLGNVIQRVTPNPEPNHQPIEPTGHPRISDYQPGDIVNEISAIVHNDDYIA